MKSTRKLLTAALIVALVTIPAKPARPMMALPPKPNLTLVECTVAVIVVGVGLTIVVGIYKMCKRLHPPLTNSFPTNTLTDWAAVGAMGDATNVVLQSAPAMSAPFNEEFTFRFAQVGMTMNVVAYRAGRPVLTNSAPISVVNGEGSCLLDFSALAAVSTNLPSGQFFRLAQ